MASGLTWTGLSGMLVARRGTTVSEVLKRVVPLIGRPRRADGSNDLGTVAVTPDTYEPWSPIGRTAVSISQRIFCRLRRGTAAPRLSRNEPQPNECAGPIGCWLAHHVPRRNGALRIFAVTADTCRQLRCFLECSGVVCNDVFSHLHGQCPSIRSRLRPGWQTACANLLLAGLWHGELAHCGSCKLSMAACYEGIRRCRRRRHLAVHIRVGR